jgi:RNA polymerase sigma factor (sigma-70 family)
MRPTRTSRSAAANVITVVACDDGLVIAYEAYAPQLRRFAIARLHDVAAADDVVQEAFIRLAIESRTSGKPDNERAWLYRVVTNLIVSGARHAAVVHRRSVLIQTAEVTVESPETQFLASERYQGLGSALEAAGADGRRGLILAAQGYSGREIAEMLGRSVGATRTLLCRARGNVRREMNAQSAGYGVARSEQDRPPSRSTALASAVPSDRPAPDTGELSMAGEARMATRLAPSHGMLDPDTAIAAAQVRAARTRFLPYRSSPGSSPG